MRRIVVLGSTGSIGTQTVDVVRQHPDELEIVGLAVNTRVADMLEQARAHNVHNLAVGEERLAADAVAVDVREQAGSQGIWGFGMDAVVLTGACADLYGPKTVRAAMGALFANMKPSVPKMVAAPVNS